MVELVPSQAQLDRRSIGLRPFSWITGVMPEWIGTRRWAPKDHRCFPCRGGILHHCIKWTELDNVSETNMHYDFKIGCNRVDLKTKYCSTPPLGSYNCTTMNTRWWKTPPTCVLQLLFNKAVPQDNLDRYSRFISSPMSGIVSWNLRKNWGCQPDPFGDGKGIVDMTEDCCHADHGISPFKRI